MFAGAIFMSLFVPLQISTHDPKFEPFLVQATIDAAVIVGMPASNAAKKHAALKQLPEFMAAEANQALAPVGWRRLYFRTHFH